jgi:retron-type reverse transcriptase
MALEALRKLGDQHDHVRDAAIRDYFGSIDHDKLMRLVARRVSDRRVLKADQAVARSSRTETLKEGE